MDTASGTGGGNPDDQWWFNLSTLKVEQGAGAGNHDRMGPYATQAEAEHALERARARSDAYDAGDDD